MSNELWRGDAPIGVLFGGEAPMNEPYLDLRLNATNLRYYCKLVALVNPGH